MSIFVNFWVPGRPRAHRTKPLDLVTFSSNLVSEALPEASPGPNTPKMTPQGTPFPKISNWLAQSGPCIPEASPRGTPWRDP